MKITFLSLLIGLTSFIYAQEFTDLCGDYLGQTPLGDTPVVFAPGIISTNHHEHSAPSFSPDGNEIFWSHWERPKNGNPQVIMHIVRENGRWGSPQKVAFTGKVIEGGPVISEDGKRLYIYREEPGKNVMIYYLTKSNNEWSNPKFVTSGFSFSVAKNGNVYFGKGDFLYKTTYQNNTYSEPILLNEKINKSGYLNWTPFVAPDESYLIFSRCDRNGDFGNLNICFRNKTNDDWSEPIEMGILINTGSQERFPSVSPDGKYFFFNRDIRGQDDIFWMSASIIERLRTIASKN